MKKKLSFYSLDKILAENADYNIIFGERSNGKTTSVLLYALKDYIESGYINQLAIIRRWEEDFKGKNGSQLFDGIINLDKVNEYSNGKYNSIIYWSQRWFLAKFDAEGNKVLQDEKPFALAFAISKEEHYKSTSYPDVKNILFDEFITRSYYIPDEFIKFQSIISTIVRLRDDLKIFMCGNTVNKYCPYFTEMGLSNVKKMKQGTIDVYTYGDTSLRVAVEYSDFPSKKKASNKYFAFNNPKLQMITNGNWEIDIYPHLPQKYLPKNVIYYFYIKFDDQILQSNIINIDNNTFMFIHRKTTPIKEDNKQLVYQQEQNYNRNYRVNILRPYDKIDHKITQFFKTNKVFYQDNEVGEVVRNYLIWCKTEN